MIRTRQYRGAIAVLTPLFLLVFLRGASLGLDLLDLPTNTDRVHQWQPNLTSEFDEHSRRNCCRDVPWWIALGLATTTWAPVFTSHQMIDRTGILKPRRSWHTISPILKRRFISRRKANGEGKRGRQTGQRQTGDTPL